MGKKNCGILIKQIHTTLEKNANNTLRKSDLTTAQVSVLLALNFKHDGKMSLKDLEKEMSLAQPTVVGIVSRLEQKGLIEYCYDISDKRMKFAQITESGRNCCAYADERMNEAEKNLLGCLTDTEKDIFLALLEKVSDSLK